MHFGVFLTDITPSKELNGLTGLTNALLAVNLCLLRINIVAGQQWCKICITYNEQWIYIILKYYYHYSTFYIILYLLNTLLHLKAINKPFIYLYYDMYYVGLAIVGLDIVLGIAGETTNDYPAPGIVGKFVATRIILGILPICHANFLCLILDLDPCDTVTATLFHTQAHTYP